MMDQGYIKAFLKFAGYSFIAIVVFFVLLFATQDEDEVMEFFHKTNLGEEIYDYWDWKRYADDFDDVDFTGHMEVIFTGDTAGLGLNQRYYQFFMEERYKEHFGDFTPYVNLDNFELMQTDERVQQLAEHARPTDIGVHVIEIDIGYMGIGPVMYKVMMKAGTDSLYPIVETSYINLGSQRKLQMSLEHGIDRELKSWAKRFYKIKGNDEQLDWLYKSVYMK